MTAHVRRPSSAYSNPDTHPTELLTVEYDPSGDFRPGACFQRFHVAMMLKQDGEAPAAEPRRLADGTRLRGRGVTLTVKGCHVVNERGGMVVLCKGLGR